MSKPSMQPKLTIVPPQPSPAPTEFSAADYLQMARAGRRSVRVEVGTGTIEMLKGELHRAVDHRGEGVDALLRLLKSGGLTGTARCFDLHRSEARNVDLDLETALLEAARQLDEAERGPHTTDLVESEPEPLMPSETDPRAAIETGIAAVLMKDYQTAYQAFRRASELGDASSVVTTNLSRLKDMLN